MGKRRVHARVNNLVARFQLAKHVCEEGVRFVSAIFYNNCLAHRRTWEPITWACHSRLSSPWQRGPICLFPRLIKQRVCSDSRRISWMMVADVADACMWLLALPTMPCLSRFTPLLFSLHFPCSYLVSCSSLFFLHFVYDGTIPIVYRGPLNSFQVVPAWIWISSEVLQQECLWIVPS